MRNVARRHLTVVSGRRSRARFLWSQRSVGAIAVGCALIAASVLHTASPADAAAYRYWSYWQGTSSNGWEYSSVGAATHRGTHGSVEGWRFAVSAGANSSHTPPRTAASFSAICGTDDPPSGKKRIGLVIDYGITGDAPRGERPPGGVARYCVEIDASANGARVLNHVASTRTSSGMVCGIDGYPEKECAAVVKDEPPVVKPSPAPSSPSTGSGSGSGGSTGGASGGARGAAGGSTGTGSTNSSSDRGTAPDTTGGTGADTPVSSDGDAGATPGATPSEGSPPGDAELSAPPDATDGPAVEAPIEVTSASATTDSGSPWGAVVTALVLAAIGGGAIAIRRRASS